MILLSCVNCCHNPLQSDAIGTQYGYCTQHKKLLLVPAQLTCGRHLRKDLPLSVASKEREGHQARFSPGAIGRLSATRFAPVNGGHTSNSAADLARLSERDRVAEVVFDYGKLETKMETIAPLHVIPGARAELAMLSLGRAYVSWCVARGGKWTSGLHLLWWVRRRIAAPPGVDGRDLRAPSPLPISRQLDLAAWSVVIMRLLFVSDVASFGGRDPIRKLATLAERAAEETGDLEPDRLLRWVRRVAVGVFDEVLPEKRYEKLAAEVRSRTSAAE